MIFNDLRIEDYCIQMSSDIPDYLTGTGERNQPLDYYASDAIGKITGKNIEFYQQAQ